MIAISALSATLAWSAAAPEDPELRRLVTLVNRQRERKSLRPLVWDDRLAAVALRHSRDMVRRRFFSHLNPDGDDPFDRMREAGIRYRAAGENVAEGQTNARQVFDDWMASPGHRANLMSRRFTHHGIAFVRGRWTHVFVGR